MHATAILLVGLLAIGCDSAPPRLSPTEDVKVLARDNNAFAIGLYAKLVDGHKRNVIFSPLSVSSALTIAYAGARGRTADEMASALRFSLPPERVHAAFGWLAQDMASMREGRPYEVCSANRLWVQSGLTLRDEFVDITREHYAGQLATTDFGQPTQAAADIDAWVAEQTQGRIPKLIGQEFPDASTSLIIVNAIHFKGDWASQFKSGASKPGTFRLLSGQPEDVRMMQQKGDFRISDQDGFRALEMPYVGDDLSMVIVLPNDMAGLPELEETLTANKISQCLSELRVRRKLRIMIPKFTMRLRSHMEDALIAMGMGVAFSPAADFSGMCEQERLFIGRVVHEAWIEVDEEGTEAAAATKVENVKKGAPRGINPTLFVADHPFLFFIRDRHTGGILFLGRLMNPRE
ncbi:serpin family protein [bacterium]|nr:serpin family protein [bacterium]